MSVAFVALSVATASTRVHRLLHKCRLGGEWDERCQEARSPAAQWPHGDTLLLSPSCHPPVTLLPPSCHPPVTLLSPSCHPPVTLLSSAWSVHSPVELPAAEWPLLITAHCTVCTSDVFINTQLLHSGMQSQNKNSSVWKKYVLVGGLCFLGHKYIFGDLHLPLIFHGRKKHKHASYCTVAWTNTTEKWARR